VGGGWGEGGGGGGGGGVGVANEEREAVVKAMEKSEKRPLPKLESMFKDVYKDMPLNLLIQEKSLQRHLSKYPIKK